jgi:hypothetical protein
MNWKNREITVVIYILILLLLIEVAFRTVKPEISGDQKHLESLPAMAERIQKYKGLRILFLGNSLIGEAIDTEIIRRGLANDTATPLVEKAVPDATQLPDWYFISKNTFLNREGIPDLLIVGFAWNGAFLDGGAVNDKIIESACHLSDFPQLCRFGIRGFEKTSEAILCRLSSVFTHRATIRNRLLDMIIPHYREGTQYINSMHNSAAKKPRQINPQYSMFKQYMELLEKKHVKTIFLAMPVSEDYHVDDELIRLIREKNIFIDMRYIKGLQKDMFVDPIHLGTQGRKIFSDNLVQQLVNHTVINGVLHKTETSKNDTKK